jgi:hypothetical protein
VVELEPAVLRVAQSCAAVNHAALQNPKVSNTKLLEACPAAASRL